MRINFLLPDFGYKPVGGFKVVYIYANAFAEYGHDVRIIYPAGCKRGLFIIPGWIRTILGINQKKEWFVLDKRISKIHTIGLYERLIPDADVTIATAYETALFLNRYSEKKGTKYYFIQGYEVWTASEKKVLESWKFSMRKIVISRYLLDIGKRNGIDDISYIPNGIDLTKYRLYTDCNKRGNCVAMIYSEAELKGSVYGINAIKKLKEILPEVKILIFGRDKRPNDLPQWIEYYENPEQDFIVKEIYNRARVFICSSICEGWGLPVMEAMACGAAVVTTDCGGIRDFVVSNENALICPVKDSDSLYQGTYRLLVDSQLRERLVNNALKTVKEYDWDDNARKFLDVISM